MNSDFETPDSGADEASLDSEILQSEIAGDEAWQQVESETQDLEIQPILNSVTSDLRGYLAERKDIRNGGAVDEEFVSMLGIDVASSAAWVDIIIDEAKGIARNSTEEDNPVVDIQELLPAKEAIELRLEDEERKTAAERYLTAHGVSEIEAYQLRHEDPARLKRLARKLDAPPAAEYSKRLASEAIEGTYTLVDEIELRVDGILSRHTRQRVALEEGNQAAIDRQKRDPRVRQALADAAIADLAAHDKSKSAGQDPQQEG